MVAVIHAGKSIRNPFHYNENKVKQGTAELIHSAGLTKDTQDLSQKDRLGTLQQLILLNQQTKVNSVHILLNFDPSERLTKEQLSAIADSYMKQIGFGGQPYLVYEHRDAGSGITALWVICLRNALLINLSHNWTSCFQ